MGTCRAIRRLEVLGRETHSRKQTFPHSKSHSRRSENIPKQKERKRENPMIYKPKGRRFYSVKFKWHGKPIQKRTKATTAKDARSIEATMRSELALGNFGILKPLIAAKWSRCALQGPSGDPA